MKKVLSVSFKYTIIILLSSVLGVILLTAVQFLPDNIIKKHSVGSVEYFKELGSNPSEVHGYTGTTIDTYTDAWMLRIACYDGPESKLSRAMCAYYYGLTSEDRGSVVDSTIALFEGAEDIERFSYTQYWHGYLSYLRPLLLVFNFSDIITIVRGIELVLFVIVALLLFSKGLCRYIPAFVGTMLFVNFSTLGTCLQYSDCIIIALTGVIVLLINKDNWKMSYRDKYAFLFIGIFTSFIDFLTYPLFTLGLCAVTVICMYQIPFSNNTSFSLCKRTIVNSISWAIGYFGMWFMKWIMGSIFSPENVFKDAFIAIKERTSSDVTGLDSSYLQVVLKNLSVISKRYYVLIVFVIFVISFRILLSDKRKLQENIRYNIDSSLSFAICFLMPFGWFFISQNHSFLHSFMVYRILGISFFGFFCGIISTNKPYNHFDQCPKEGDSL